MIRGMAWLGWSCIQLASFMNEKVYPTLTSCYKDHANDTSLCVCGGEGMNDLSKCWSLVSVLVEAMFGSFL